MLKATFKEKNKNTRVYMSVHGASTNLYFDGDTEVVHGGTAFTDSPLCRFIEPEKV